MQKLDFHANQEHTLGVELELALVDADTMELASAVEAVLRELPNSDGRSFKPELMQCCVEIVTGICPSVAAAEMDLREKFVN